MRGRKGAMKAMRRILFRGKNLFGKWIEGDLIQYIIYGKMHIARNSWGAGGQEVVPETVGQYTGVTDVNSNKIFEGDIVISDYIDYEDERGVVQWDSDIAKFIITFSTFTIDFDNVYGREFEVVGNVYDNPEMMEKIEEDYE